MSLVEGERESMTAGQRESGIALKLGNGKKNTPLYIFYVILRSETKIQFTIKLWQYKLNWWADTAMVIIEKHCCEFLRARYPTHRQQIVKLNTWSIQEKCCV